MSYCTNVQLLFKMYFLFLGNRETAFISAVASAGIVHAITKGCSTGNLTECGCDSQPAGQRYTDMVSVCKYQNPLI